MLQNAEFLGYAVTWLMLLNNHFFKNIVTWFFLPNNFSNSFFSLNIQEEHVLVVAMWWSFLGLDWPRREMNVQICYRGNGKIPQHFAVAHHKDGDWSTAQRKCRPTTCGWRNGQCYCIHRFLGAQQWRQQYPYQFAEFVELKYPVNDRGCRQKCLDRKLAMISSCILFFLTSGAVSAYNGKHGQLKEQRVLFWEQSLLFQNYSWIQRILKSNSMMQKHLYWVAQCISGVLIQFPSTLFQWLELLFMLWVLAACSQDCCFSVQGPVPHSCWFCSFFCRVTPFLSEPQTCLCGVGHALVKKPAANKHDFWWFVVWTKLPSQGGAVCDRMSSWARNNILHMQ